MVQAYIAVRAGVFGGVGHGLTHNRVDFPVHLRAQAYLARRQRQLELDAAFIFDTIYHF